jgi:ATP-dependent helicase HepA
MSNNTYIPGQRWISDAEPELGLGTLIKHEIRTITLLYPASGETRIYAKDNAPITRVTLQPGDITEDVHGSILKIVSVREDSGIYFYSAQQQDETEIDFSEELLSNFLQFNRPQQRLLNGFIDKNNWFDLRRRAIKHKQQLSQSDLIGLGGARIDLLPHQLYIAHEVGKRLTPRVLLADEVGLGKTIEACLILHRQLLSGNANRALIVVPEPLLHQWLVELIRRFNLRFSLFDEERCQAIVESGQSENPFQAEQLIICSLDLITNSQQRLNQALNAKWDILIVDEAHHLEWHEDEPSVAYQAIDMLSKSIPGVLLLTATPEQLGRSGHFARLRLLDPSRFHSLDAFLQEQEQYQPVAEAAQQLLSDSQLSEQQITTLSQLLAHDHVSEVIDKLQDNNTTEEQKTAIREQLIDMLLDRHGTGRVLFRNTRNRIKGFSSRCFNSYPLEYPVEYQSIVTHDLTNPLQLLYPETVYASEKGSHWWQFDPRLEWLISKLKELGNEKVLLICSSANTAMELEQALRQREGIAAGLFHEQRSIIERDRAAAWFADMEQGCQVLICSEIGSEGRNFQFAHHLILFDLPANPDLLEQRIGRLDRIGQRHTIQLNAPYFKESAQEVLLEWYNQGLNAFEHTCAPGQQIFKQQMPVLTQAMLDAGSGQKTPDQLIQSTKELLKAANHQLEQGRDHLLELNSCRMQQAESIKHSLEAEDNSSNLPEFMDDLLAAYNLDVEFHSKQSQVVKPGQHMRVEHFPNLPAEGVTMTYHRPSALAHEDWQFLTWEHPMVLDAMEMLLEREDGNSCATAIRHPDIPSNSIFLELLFVLECPAPRELQAGRFLPPTLIRVVMDQKGTDQSKLLTPDIITQNTHHLDKNVLRKLIRQLQPLIQGMLQQGEIHAQKTSSDLVPNAIDKMSTTYDFEIERMDSLREINPNIKPEEIEIMRKHKSQLETHMDSSRIRLDALRFIVTL